jgi:sulfite exporter TauE/SafE
LIASSPKEKILLANLGLIFLTGLTTGGLSCLAVQGGLLASSLSEKTEAAVGALTGTSRGEKFEQELAALKAKDLPKKSFMKAMQKLKHRYPLVETQQANKDKGLGLAKPIMLFLIAKLVAYTILGFTLGWIGSLLQLTPMMRAILQITIGIFMLGTALRMLNVHPIFRHFMIEPPKFVSRYIRRKSKQADGNWLAPTFLGALTVLIPCGITQAMMALAVASGKPVAGALIMFAFVLGTTPLFFTLAYLATKLGERWQTKFWKVTGVVVLVLALISINGGLTLAGSPWSFTAMSQSIGGSIAEAQHQNGGAQGPASAAPTGVPANENNELTMKITDQAYTPAVMQAKADVPIKLAVSTLNVKGCGRSLVIPSLNKQLMLGATDAQTIELPAQKAGSSIRLTCVMGMYNATINVD